MGMSEKKDEKGRKVTSDSITYPKRRQRVGSYGVGKSTMLKFSSSLLNTLLNPILFGIMGLVANKERIKIFFGMKFY